MIANQDKHMYDIIGLVESLRYEKILINQDQTIKEKFQIEFIVDVQSLTQCGEGK